MIIAMLYPHETVDAGGERPELTGTLMPGQRHDRDPSASSVPVAWISLGRRFESCRGHSAAGHRRTGKRDSRSTPRLPHAFVRSEPVQRGRRSYSRRLARHVDVRVMETRSCPR